MENKITRQSRSKLLLGIFASFIILTSMLFSIGMVSAAQLPINLGEAGHFVILSEAQITDLGDASTSLITGDIGVHPAAGTFIQDVSSSTVTGIIYDNNAGYTGGFDSNTTDLVTDPVLLGLAIFDMDAARLDAQGRITNDVTLDTNELDIGILSPTTPTFKPGLHTWSTGVTITDSITLNGEGDTNSVFIFQIAQTLTVNNGAIITLTNGAQAKNIFWVVSGATTLGTTSVFEGTILGVTGISTLADSTVHGRLLAQTAITLDGTTNVVTMPGTMPATPVVTNDDTLNTVSNIALGMEYKFDSAVNYTAYDALTFNALDFSGDHTLLVRVAAQGINPASLDTILTFTTNPVIPTPSSGSGGGSSGGGHFSSSNRITVYGVPTVAVVEPAIIVPIEETPGTTVPSTTGGLTGAVTGGIRNLTKSALAWVVVGLIAATGIVTFVVSSVAAKRK